MQVTGSPRWDYQKKKVLDGAQSLFCDAITKIETAFRFSPSTYLSTYCDRTKPNEGDLHFRKVSIVGGKEEAQFPVPSTQLTTLASTRHSKHSILSALVQTRPSIRTMSSSAMESISSGDIDAASSTQTQTQTQTTINTLPDELLLAVLSVLSIKDRAKVRTVSKK